MLDERHRGDRAGLDNVGERPGVSINGWCVSATEDVGRNLAESRIDAQWRREGVERPVHITVDEEHVDEPDHLGFGQPCQFGDDLTGE